jgi:hypothetical protein
VGEVETIIKSLGLEGVLNVRVISYLAGREYKSDEIERLFFQPNPVQTSFTDDLNQDNGDFIGNGWQITRRGGFRSSALHSEHPYPQLTELITVLKTPITIQQDNPILSYKDVVIVETGEPGTQFGDQEFWDYVVVEGSLDGSNWTPLAPGYDSSFDPAWQSAYDREESGSEDLFVEHMINLTDSFNVDDTILIRFRLFSDPFTVGWGWMIDDIKIQERILSTEDELNADFVIYPNPMTDFAKVSYNWKQSEIGSISLIDLNGRTIRQFETVNRIGSIQIDRTGLETGVYVLRFTSSSGTTSRKLLVE